MKQIFQNLINQLYITNYKRVLFFLLTLNFIVIQLSAQNKILATTNGDTTNFEAHILGEPIQTSCEGVIELFAQEVRNVSYYKWYLNDQPFDEGRNLITTLSGRYKLVVGKGNYQAISAEVTVILNTKPKAKIVQSNKTYFFDNGTLNADLIHPDATYKWIMKGATIGEGTEIRITQSGIYTLQVTQNGCQASTQIEVFILPTSPFSFLELEKNVFKTHLKTILRETIQISVFDKNN